LAEWYFIAEGVSMGDKEFLSLTEAAEHIGVSRNKIWRLVKDGRLEAYRDPKDDRVKLVKKTDLDTLIQPNKAGA
jgi:excisionase family DNA binding protein